MPQHDSGPDVLRVEDVLHRQCVRSMAREQLCHAFIDLVESIREWVACSRADDATFDKGDGPIAVSLYDTVAGGRGSRIDPKNNQKGQGRGFRVEGRGSRWETRSGKCRYPKPSPLNPRPSPLDHCRHIDIKVRPYLLHVVQLLERFEQLEE